MSTTRDCQKCVWGGSNPTKQDKTKKYKRAKEQAQSAEGSCGASTNFWHIGQQGNGGQCEITLTHRYFMVLTIQSSFI